MSYIHEALIKAQKERNYHQPKDQVQVAETVGMTTRASWMTLTILLILISMLFAIIVFSWFKSLQKEQQSNTENVYQKKSVVMRPEQNKKSEPSKFIVQAKNNKKSVEKKIIVNTEKKTKASIHKQSEVINQKEIVIKEKTENIEYNSSIEDNSSDDTDIYEHSQEVIGPGQFLEVSRLYDKGLKYQVQKKYDSAITYYQKCLEISPHMAPALNNMGVILLKKKDYQQAKTYFLTAIKESPDYVDPYYNLACLFSQIKNVHQAIEYLKKAVQIYEEARNWAITDSDFEPLYELIEFNKIISGY